MDYYSAIKKNTFESVLMRWIKLEPIIQSEVSQKERGLFLLDFTRVAQFVQAKPEVINPKYQNINNPWSHLKTVQIPPGTQMPFSQSVSSVAQSCPTLCDPMNRSPPGLPVHHQLPEFIQTLVHWVSDAIKPSHPLLSPSPPALNLSQHQDLFQWVNSSHQVAKVLEFQLQHQSFQWTPRTDL